MARLALHTLALLALLLGALNATATQAPPRPVLSAPLTPPIALPTLIQTWPSESAPGSSAPASAQARQATANTLRFVVAGDSRGTDAGAPVNTQILGELVTATLSETVDFILFTGDLVFGSPNATTLESQLGAWRAIAQPLYDAGVGVYPVRGNHDADSKVAWDNVFTGTYALPGNGPSGEENVTFSFTHTNALIVGLDQYANPNRVNQAWLDAQFASNTQPHVFVFGHEPAFEVYHASCLGVYADARDAFWSSIAAEGGRVYLAGHDHFYNHARLDDGDGNPGDDVHQFVVGTAGAPLYAWDSSYSGNNGPWTPQLVHYEQEWGYLLVEIGSQNSVTLTWKHRTAPGVYEPGGDIFTYLAAPSNLGAGDVIIAGFQALDNLFTQNPAEFVELFNTTDQSIALENLELISRVDSNDDGVVDVEWQLSTDLTGKAIAPHSFFLIAESGVAAPGGVHDVETDMNLNTSAGGADERAVSLELVIGGQHMDYVLYGRHDGTDLPLDVPPGDLPFDGSSWPRNEVVRNTTGDDYFAEGLVRRASAGDLYAGYDVEGFYTDEDSLGDGFPNGAWASQHITLYNCYQARNSLSPPVLPPPDQPLLVSPGDGQANVTLDPELRVNVTHPALDEMEVTFYGREAGAEAGDDFTIIVLPDTQYYAETYTRTFISQTQWIVDNQEALNVVYVAHVGDLVETANLTSEWEVASAAMGLLENPLTTGLPDGLPYGPAVGNHDQFPADDPGGTALYNVYFGESRFAGRGYYGGHYGDDNDNHYALFSASGMDFIVMDLEYDPFPGVAVLAWAENLLQTYSERRAILVSHYLLIPNACFSPQGQATFDALADNANLFLMLCGHVSYEAKRRDAPGENVLYTLLADYQERLNGGNGWLRLLEFSPANDEIRVKTFSPLLDQYETDKDSQFVLSYDMRGAFTELGRVSGMASGGDAALDWPGRSYDTAYEWHVVVSDGDASTRGPTWTFTTTRQAVPGTAPVTVTISGPTTGEPGQSTTFTASVSPLTTTPPLTYTWQASGQAEVVTNTEALSHSVSYTWDTVGRQAITVTARNALDAVSSTHHITISVAPPVPPDSVRISGPTTGGVGQSYTFTATITPLTTATPLTYTWQASGQSEVLTSTEALSHNVSYTWHTVGRQTITVTARNALDAVSTTHSITISTTVPPNHVTISGPTTGEPGQSYTFTASVSPGTTTLPLTYAWQASGQVDVLTSTEALSHSVSYTWDTTGAQTITVTARNALDAVSATHSLDVVPFYVYLPLALKSQ